MILVRDKGVGGIVCGLLVCSILLSGIGLSCKPTRGRAGDKVTLVIAEHRVDVEVSCDDRSRKRGLMYRESLPEDAGMLFIFPRREARGFWMKNTRIPLSIAFLDDDGKILQIENMRPNDLSSTTSMMRVRYALEMNQGWFARHDVEVGDTFTDFRSRVGHFDAY